MVCSMSSYCWGVGPVIVSKWSLVRPTYIHEGVAARCTANMHGASAERIGWKNAVHEHKESCVAKCLFVPAASDTPTGMQVMESMMWQHREPVKAASSAMDSHFSKSQS